MTTATLHIHAQEAWHQPAYLLGTPDALRALRAAIDRALEAGRPEAMLTYCRDGEGYIIVVIPVAEVTDDDALPYTDPYDGWVANGKGPHEWLTADDVARIWPRRTP